MSTLNVFSWGRICKVSVILLAFTCSHSNRRITHQSTTAPIQKTNPATVLANTLTKEEVDAGWQLLFDGKTTAGWRKPYKEFFPEKGWTIQNGELTVRGGLGGSIITIDQFGDFELKLEFKLTRAANSGIKYNVVEKYDGDVVGLEYQIIDDVGYPQPLKDVQHCASLYDLIPAVNTQLRPIGEWNEARIIVQGKHVEHWLNGVKGVDYRRCDQTFRALIRKSKFAKYEKFGCWPQGHILLQDHGDEVSFRNIKVRRLN